MELKWIKIVPDMFDDDKIQLIESMPKGDTILVIWFRLLCFAGKKNNGGVFMVNEKTPYTLEQFATIFHRPKTAIKLAFDTFERFGMIEVINQTYIITNWEKHQNIDKLDEIREYNKQKQRESRAKRKLSQNVNDNVNDKSMTSQPCQTIEEERDKEKEFLFSLSRARVWEKYFVETSTIKMSNAEFDEICDNLSIEDVDRYLGIIENCEENGKPYTKKTHFQAVMDMATNDSKVVKRKKGSSKKLECGGAYDLAAFEKALDEK